MKILDIFLSNYNDGRKKTLFCIAVNLFGIARASSGALGNSKHNSDIEMLTLKEKSAYIARLLKDVAATKIST